MNFFPRRLVSVIAIALALVMPLLPRGAVAQQILRDAETEWFIRQLATPFFEAAGLNPSAVKIYLIHDNTINAFTTLGQIMAIYSGLIQSAENVNMLEGVIAHETGHIAGGHAVRYAEAQSAALKILLASVLLGLAAAAAGSGDAAAGLIIGGQSMAQRDYLRYSRVQESVTDQAALTYLEASGTSARGLVDFFDHLRDQELLPINSRSEYYRTHPIPGNRILLLIDRARESEFYDAPSSPEKEYWFKRVQAKLDGFVNDPAYTFRKYPPKDQSIYARYARVYAYQKDLQWDNALAEANSLIAEIPDDPYFHEIAGQVLFEYGKVEEALPYLRRARDLLPRESLILTQLGHALVALDTPETDTEALEVLRLAVFFDPQDDFAWRQLATVYTRTKQESLAHLAAAEMFNLHGRYPRAIQEANQALPRFKEGSREWLQAQDLISAARHDMENDPRFKD